MSKNEVAKCESQALAHQARREHSTRQTLKGKRLASKARQEIDQ